MANKIFIKRGTKAKLPTLGVGELAFCTDTKELFVGSADGNVQYYTKEQVMSLMGNKAPLASPALTGTPTVNNVAIATTTPPQEINLALPQEWSGTVRYFKTQESVVVVTVRVSKSAPMGKGNINIGLMPSGYRPRANEERASANNETAASPLPTASPILINSGGGTSVWQTDAAAQGIAGIITYRAAGG